MLSSKHRHLQQRRCIYILVVIKHRHRAGCHLEGDDIESESFKIVFTCICAACLAASLDLVCGQGVEWMVIRRCFHHGETAGIYGTSVSLICTWQDLSHQQLPTMLLFAFRKRKVTGQSLDTKISGMCCLTRSTARTLVHELFKMQ